LRNILNFVRARKSTDEADRQVRGGLARIALPPELVAGALLNIKVEGVKAAWAV